MNEQPETFVEALDKFSAAVAQCVEALNKWAEHEFVPLVERLVSALDRRYATEQKLGYHVPDWVWAVWERQRETLGSGNGRMSQEG